MNLHELDGELQQCRMCRSYATYIHSGDDVLFSAPRLAVVPERRLTENRHEDISNADASFVAPKQLPLTFFISVMSRACLVSTASCSSGRGVSGLAARDDGEAESTIKPPLSVIVSREAETSKSCQKSSGPNALVSV